MNVPIVKKHLFLLYFYMLHRLFSLTFFVFVLSACQGSSNGSGVDKIFADIEVWNSVESAKKSYPNLDPHEAQKRHVTEKFQAVASSLKTEKERKLLAAVIYLNFSFTNSRARFAYCKEMSLDIEGFVQLFKNKNVSEERVTDRILNENGLVREDLWKQRRKRAMAAVKYDLMNFGNTNGSWAACKELRDNPQQFSPYVSFAKILPAVARELR